MVNPNVRLLKLIGEGGMGSVWVADHLTLQTQVAVKFIASHGDELSPRAVARFKREAAAAAKIKSPHVVQTFDHGLIDDELPYIVMELLEGETVGQRVERLRVLPPRDVVKIVRQVSLVLDQAHQLGIVHRDIKPDNLFLITSGYDVFVKVLDFGIAKHTSLPEASMVTADNAMVGTPAFMSPEQIETPRRADHRADLWALAVVAYHCFTGHYPFTGETVGSLAISISKGRFKAPSVLKHGLPGELDAWFRKALHRNIEQRFTTAGAMAKELEPIIEEWMIDFESVSTKRVTATDSFSELIPASVRSDVQSGSDDAVAALSALQTNDEQTSSDGPLEEIPVAGGKTVDGFGSSATLSSAPPRRGLKLAVVGAAIAVAAAAGVLVAHTGGPLSPKTDTAGLATTGQTATAPTTIRSTVTRSTVTRSAATHTTAAQPSDSRTGPATASGQPTATPTPKAAATETGPARQPTAQRPATSTATAKPSARNQPSPPAYCETDGFYVDARGNLVPKPECLRR